MKAARRLDPADSEQNADRQEIRLRERSTDAVHVYEGWAWEDDAPDEGPDWLSDTVTQANVSKEGVEHLDGS
jgi:hypothetical protein